MTSDPSSADDDQAADERWAERCAVLGKAWVQIRYHRYRQRFFDLADRISKCLTIVLGASLFGQYVANVVPWLATAITSIGLLALVFGYSDRKNLHKSLAEQAASLAEEIERVPASELDAVLTAGWAADYLKLCASAPPPLKTLSLICEGEQAAADGHKDHVPQPNWCLRLLRHVY